MKNEFFCYGCKMHKPIEQKKSKTTGGKALCQYCDKNIKRRVRGQKL